MLLLAALLWAPESWAQTLVLNETGGIERDRPTYTPARPWWISHADCLANDVFRFSLTRTGATNQVEVWVGSDDCVATRNEPDGEHGQCWIVARDPSPDDIVDIDVPVRNVVARRLDAVAPPENLPASVCDEPTDQNGETVTFYFMVVESGQARASDTWTGGTGLTGFDTLGPVPPGTVSVGVGERQLAIEIDNFDEDDDLLRFEAFCVPQGTEGPPPEIPASNDDTGATDAGSTSSSGTLDGGTATAAPGTGTSGGIPAANLAPAECFSPIIAAEARPPTGFSCGVVSKDSRALRTNELINGVQYAVGVAGQDILGNAGVLSDVQCGMPIPLNDFYEVYIEAGGRGGGGFCSFSAPPFGSPRPRIGWLALLVAGLLWRRVRARA
jgi:hypothetical protein